MRAFFRRENLLSWFWLLVGAGLLPFANLQTVVPAAVWLAPVFLLRFERTQLNAGVALVAVFIVHAGAFLFGLRDGYLPASMFVLALSGVAFGLLFTSAYVADRFIAVRLGGVARTLVFPVTLTVALWLQSLTPLGTFAAPAYTQAGSLSLLQVTALVGTAGVSFLVMWFGPVVNAVWEEAGEETAAWRPAVLYAGVLCLTLLYGGARMVFTDMPLQSVRVAAVTPDRELRTAAFGSWAAADLNPSEPREALRARFEPVLEDLLARTEQAARAGARIVSWTEAAAVVLKEDEAAVVERAAALARQEGLYLQITLGTLLDPGQMPLFENKAVLIDPAGTVRWTYDKSHPVPVGAAAHQKPGSGVLPVVDTPYGLLSAVIGYDADFPPLIRQAGQAGVNLLLVPSDDDRAMRALRAQVAPFRAVENGLALLRPASNGISIAVDPFGRVLGRADHFADSRAVLLVDVPVGRAPTVYARFGDLFIYLCIGGLLTLLISVAAWQDREAEEVERLQAA